VTSYDWGRPGATALILPFPAAEPLIGKYRRAHTPSGAEGMVAHATLLAPFIHQSALSEDDLEAVDCVLRRFEPFRVTLGSRARFGEIGVLYLKPEPREPIVALSEALLEVFPQVEYPPGATEIVPHATVASRLPPDELDRIEAELSLRLPIDQVVREALLMQRSTDGRWETRAGYALARA
jgi:2'-5' RNA ligase